MMLDARIPRMLHKEAEARLRATIRQRTLTYVKRFPGRSATHIANVLHLNPASVSSVLVTMVNEGVLRRKDGLGPRGGYGYFFRGVRAAHGRAQAKHRPARRRQAHTKPNKDGDR
jgi:hypothetical protein